MLHYLRYAPAAFFALLALAFVCLWVRSCWRYSSIAGPVRGGVLLCSSSSGVVYINFIRSGPMPDVKDWEIDSGKITSPPYRSPLRNGFLGLLIPTSKEKFSAMLPYWFLALTSLALAALLAFKPITRFTVRGLLITTTLLAAVLGLAVYAV